MLQVIRFMLLLSILPFAAHAAGPSGIPLAIELALGVVAVVCLTALPAGFIFLVYHGIKWLRSSYHRPN